MQILLNRYVMLIKRWGWMILLGVIICGGATFTVSKFTHPIYQASAILVVSVSTSNSVDTNSSIASVPTYAQLITNPLVLNPVVAKHPGITLQQLSGMVTVQPQSNTQLIELSVQNSNPQLAARLANEIGQSFQQYTNAQLPASIQILPAQTPTTPFKPRPLQDTGLGALVGLGLAIVLILIFEWFADRLSNPEEVQKLLGMEILTVLPKLAGNQRGKKVQANFALVERYRILSANLHVTKESIRFKSVLVTSALGGEGKSTVAANLASFLAMTGKRVLLVDANLRHPTLDQHFQLDNNRGLSNVFIEMGDSPRPEFYSQETDVPTLHVLTSGIVPPKPAELLQSSLADQIFNHLNKTPFDYIIFDSPPLVPVADAQILISLVQSVILVVDAHDTPRRALVRVKDILNRSKTPILGVVINKSSWQDYGIKHQYPTNSMHQTQVFPELSQDVTQPLIRPPKFVDGKTQGNVAFSPKRQQIRMNQGDNDGDKQ